MIRTDILKLGVVCCFGMWHRNYSLSFSAPFVFFNYEDQDQIQHNLYSAIMSYHASKQLLRYSPGLSPQTSIRQNILYYMFIYCTCMQTWIKLGTEDNIIIIILIFILLLLICFPFFLILRLPTIGLYIVATIAL